MITIKTFLFNLQSFFFFLEEPSTLIRTAHTPQTWKKQAGVGEGAPGTAVQSLKFHRGKGERKGGLQWGQLVLLSPRGLPAVLQARQVFWFRCFWRPQTRRYHPEACAENAGAVCIPPPAAGPIPSHAACTSCTAPSRSCLRPASGWSPHHVAGLPGTEHFQVQHLIFRGRGLTFPECLWPCLGRPPFKHYIGFTSLPL